MEKSKGLKKPKSDLLVIEAGKKGFYNWKELWSYRELFLFLAWKDILVRYKQTIFGLAWAFFRPFVTMVILTVVFGNFAKFPSNGIPYAVLVYSALLPWMFFSSSFSDIGGCLVSNSNLITKVYFPRIVLPISSIITQLVDFAISFAIFIGIMIWFQFIPSWAFITLPLFLLLNIIFTFGAGILIASLNVRFRDFGYLVPFIIQFGLYLSPVGYLTSVIPPEWRILYGFNPMVGIIDGFRWAILGEPIFLPDLLLSILMTGIILVIGLWYFRKTEKTFADII